MNESYSFNAAETGEKEQAQNQLVIQDKLLQAVNQAAALLLALDDNEDIESPIVASMEIIGRSINADRIHIWRNEISGDDVLFSRTYYWLSGTGQQKAEVPAGAMPPYQKKSEWENKFIRNEYVGGPISKLSQEEREFFGAFDIKSVILIPLFLDEQLWGLVSIDDCKQEREFSEDEIDLLRSVSLMIASSIDRLSLAAKIKEANKRLTLMLDTSPMCTQIWDKNLNTIDCNEAGVRLYGFKNKQEYIDKFLENCSPEYQTDGQRSDEKAVMLVSKTFEEGHCVFDWMHQIPGDGTLMPAEVTLVRAKYGDDDVVVGYTRDMRKHCKMMEAIEYKDRLLLAVNQTAGFLLNSDVQSFEKALNKGLGVIAETVDADCVYIWKNSIVNGLLHCAQLHEWSEQSTIYNENKKLYSYDETFPGWEKTLLNRSCLNGPAREMSREVQDFLSPAGILSILVVPIFIEDQFWGFVGFDDCHKERFFTQEEESILRSASMLIADAVIRNEMTHDILDKSAQLEAAMEEVHQATIIKNNSLKALENILNSLDASVYVTAPDTGELLFVNTHLKKLFNIEGDEAIGKYCYKIFRNNLERCSFCPCLRLSKDSDETIVWEEYLPELGMYVRHSDCYIDWPDGRKVHLQHSIDITEMVRATDKAQAASKAKSDFLASMSHEMRTPMNAIVGITAIGKKAKDIEGKKYALNKIEEASSHLLGVINDILDMAKIEANKLELAPVQYHFEKMLQKVLTVINFRADERQQVLIVNIDYKIPRLVVGDDQRMAQVITNLLSNAVKFSYEGGEICLNASLASETDDHCELLIEVSDNGIGISPEQQERLFGAFEQVQNGTSRKYGGTGLGLTITKRIVEMMDGRIWVESELDKGSKFICTVWVGRAPENEDDSSEGESLSEGAADGVYRFEGKRLLIVEDIEINREILITLLEDSGLIIDCAENGKEALDIIKAEPEKYDIVFMDLRMPQMDGLEATRRIRSLPPRQRKKLPIVAMTANVFKEDIKACLAAGMDDHLGKPVDIDKVIGVLRKYL